jgi:hypothetical protein
LSATTICSEIRELGSPSSSASDPLPHLSHQQPYDLPNNEADDDLIMMMVVIMVTMMILEMMVECRKHIGNKVTHNTKS